MYKKSVWNKRRRKRHLLGEFTVWGFEAKVTVSPSDDSAEQNKLQDTISNMFRTQYNVVICPFFTNPEHTQMHLSVQQEPDPKGRYPRISEELKQQLLSELAKVPGIVSVDSSTPVYDLFNFEYQDGKVVMPEIEKDIWAPLYRELVIRRRCYLKFMQEQGKEPQPVPAV